MSDTNTNTVSTNGAGNIDTTPTVTRVYPTETTTTATATDGTAAVRYVERELVWARRNLLVTQIATVALSLFIALYMGYITSTVTRTLEPEAAAQVATGLLSQQVDTQGQQIAENIKQQVPTLIGQLPDYALKQIPQYRTALEARVEGDMHSALNSSSEQLSKSVDQMLETNKDGIKELLTNGSDPAAAQKVGDAIEKDLTSYLNTASVNGESLSSKLTQSLAALESVQKRMAHLAQNKNLTASEKKARRAIAILSQKIETSRQQPGNPLVNKGA